MQKRTGPIFLSLTFGLVLVFWGTLAVLCQLGVAAYGTPLFFIPYLLGGFSPTIAALVTIPRSEGREGWKRYRTQLFAFRQPWVLYLVLAAVSFVYTVGFNFVGTGLATGVWPGLGLAWWMFLPGILIMTVGGGLEELGWRGVLLPWLKERLAPGPAIAVVAILWTLWHLPLWFMPGTSQSTVNFLDFALSVTSYSILLGGLWIRTQSIGLCVLFHAMLNSWLDLGLKSAYAGWGPILLVGAAKILLAVAIYQLLVRTGRPRPAGTA